MPASLLRILASLIVTVGTVACSMCPRTPSVYDEAALGAAHWLQAVGGTTDGGRTWPVEPDRSATGAVDLYSGNAGVVLFFIEAWKRTGRPEFLRDAHDGARALAATLPDRGGASIDAGFFTGIAGRGYVLDRAYRATGDDALRVGALRCVRLLHETARHVGRGVEWSAVNDLVSGSAGTGLFLLYAAAEMDHRPSVELAILAGRRLIEKAIPNGGGLKWRIDPTFERLMPNFSHGTAGVSFFLALLHEVTGDDDFLQAALAGGAYLLESADERGLVFHHEPGGEDLFYLGWCHGPAGTGRLFLKLWKTTGERRWLDAVHRAARSVMESGILAGETDGFWNNSGLCCGLAGVAAYYVDLHRESARSEYGEFARILTDEIVRRASIDGRGFRWIDAEHRIRPELLSAQTGLMQGAAGIGIWLLRFAGDQGAAGDPLLPFGILCPSSRKASP